MKHTMKWLTWLVAAWLGAAPWPGPPDTHCTSTYDQLLNRWETICLDGTRGISTWNALLERWETTVTRPSALPSQPPPWKREHR